MNYEMLMGLKKIESCKIKDFVYTLIRENEDLKKDVEELKKLNSEFKYRLKMHIDEHQGISKLKNENEELKKDVVFAENVIEELKKSNAALRNAVSNLTTHNIDLKKQLDKCRFN